MPVEAKALQQASYPLNLDEQIDNPQDLRESACVLHLLAGYAEHMANAATLRQMQKFEAALFCESQADLAYSQLPEWAKWG